jgi:hypothetical protein
VRVEAPLDVSSRSTEAAEAQIDAFISRMDTRRRDTEGERLTEELWVDSARRHAAKLREAARVEWTLYHEHMSLLHAQLSQEHAAKAERLCEDSEAEDRGEGLS